MRIIGGALRGRRLPGRPAPNTRPTSDRTREGIASALQARNAFEGATVLDLFAGTGALGLEALSRGARRLVAVDQDRDAVRCVKDNARALELSEQAQVLQLDLLGKHAAATLASRLATQTELRFDLVFVDPPYALVQVGTDLVAELCARGLLREGALVVIEHGKKLVPRLPPGLRELTRYRYGDTEVALWEAIAPGTGT